MNILDPIFLQAALDPLRPAVAYPGGLATYGMLARSANNVAANLIALGVRERQVCAIRIRDPLLHLLVVMGLGRMGAASLSLSDTKPLETFGLDIAASLVSERLPGDHEHNVVVVDERFYREARSSSLFADRIKGYDGAGSDLVSICMSSGSTGRPKAVGLTNDILADRMSGPLGRGAEARTLSMMGFDVLGGYSNAVATLRIGGLVCFAPPGPMVLEMASFFGITDLIASPAQLLTLLAEQRERARFLPALRSIFVGGAQLPAESQLDAERLFSARILIAYGSTEAGLVTLAPSTLAGPGARTCGYPMPWLEVEVVTDDGESVPVGAEGHVRVRGPGVVTSYLGSEPADHDIFRHGWFHPGDLGNFDAAGLLHVTGRVGTRINRGGVKIVPESIENVILAHPDVADCGVGAMETRDGHLRIIAAVVPRGPMESPEALYAFCRERIPDRVPDDFLLIEVIPKTSMGKIAREELNRRLRELYAGAAD